MKTGTMACVALLAAVIGLSPLHAQSGNSPAAGGEAACAPDGDFKFLCGVRAPEDETLIPGTRWLITSGMRAGEGLKLVDTDAKSFRFFYTGAPDQIRPDKTLYPDCAAPPEPKSFIAHGLYLRAAPEPGLYRLYVVSHGALESIQVFAVDARGEAPALTWTGCVPLPEGDKHSNAVAAFSDGTILVTLFERAAFERATRRPGMAIRESFRGQPTGDVLEWKPGAAAFRSLGKATQLPGTNGIELSPDESEFYVVAYGTHSVHVFSRRDPSRELRSVAAPGFTPDNLRWSGARLLAAGPVLDEPRCGGTPLQAWNNPAIGRCNRGYIVAELDPGAMTWRILAYAEPSARLGSVATGVIRGDTLWIGAVDAEGLGYRPLPKPTTAPPMSLAQMAFPPPPPDPAACAPGHGLNFLCGARSPEDVTLIPGTRWLVASGMRPGEGLKLVDADAKSFRLFYTGAPEQIRADKALYPDCPAPPEPKSFNAHGLYLRTTGTAGLYKLFVVSHGALESIQVFNLDARGDTPVLAWTGCVPMPAADIKGNSVVALKNGTILVTVQDRPGTVHLQDLKGENVGDVMEWKPGAKTFHALPGARLPGDNGLELSRDESEFYVEAVGNHTVYVFSSRNPGRPLRSTVAPGFTPDNLRWSGDRLLAAGMILDDPGCGGTPLQQAEDYPNLGRCNRGYEVAQLDPKKLTWSTVAYAQPSPQIGTVATGVIKGDTLWLGAVWVEGLGYRPLPGPALTVTPAGPARPAAKTD